MLNIEFREKIARGACAAFADVFQSLANSFARVGCRCDVEQPLVGFCILDNGGGFALHCEDYRALAPLELFEEVRRAAAEGGQRLNILSEIEHGFSSTLLGAY